MSSVQFSYTVMSDSWDPVDWSSPGFPVHHQLLELAQIHIHQVGDAIQSSRPLLSPSPPVFNLSQHQGLFQWVNYLHQVAKVLELQLQHQSFQWIFRTDFLEDSLVWSPCSPRDSQESSLTPQFKSINSSALSNSVDQGSIPRSGRSLGKGNGYPLQYPLAGEFHGQRSLVGYSPWHCKESDMPVWLTNFKYSKNFHCKMWNNVFIKESIWQHFAVKKSKLFPNK